MGYVYVYVYVYINMYARMRAGSGREDYPCETMSIFLRGAVSKARAEGKAEKGELAREMQGDQNTYGSIGLLLALPFTRKSSLEGFLLWPYPEQTQGTYCLHTKVFRLSLIF